MKITAAVARAIAAPLSLETVELASPRPDQVLVRMVATGICHTDAPVAGSVILLSPHHGPVGNIGSVSKRLSGLSVCPE